MTVIVFPGKSSRSLLLGVDAVLAGWTTGSGVARTVADARLTLG
jgi:hypothetical protein